MKYILSAIFFSLLLSCANNSDNIPGFVPIDLSTYTKIVSSDETMRGTFVDEKILVTSNSVLTIAGGTFLRCLIEVDEGSSISFTNTTDMRDMQIILHGEDQLCVATQGISVIINDNTFTNIATGCYDDDDLPVELIYFTSKLVSEDILLEWATATETNSDIYEIQRSYDQKSWDILDTVQAAGNSDVKLEYDYTDSDYKNINGVVYHRLNQIDLDGNNNYFGPVAVKHGDHAEDEVIMYPNPVNFGDDLNITTTFESMNIKIYDSIGRIHYERSHSSNFATIPMYFGTGLLIVEIKSGSSTITEKVIVE
ncbi:T9SS type A sorting domain-containing protein [Flammeovirga pacifica]|uniref:Secretion system C-terminal sorting domain-containing protein n=1 Tax=Flammeovirga pacifica TaxID=915059 RepID=A0A1S1YU99_FLAPC|nr:T9SS type A sorting domain-containing protein [Flammeovirga pacifica]OHX64604.1 hypothetical protein NH26_23830 [Flammeovirga pacifica]